MEKRDIILLFVPLLILGLILFVDNPSMYGSHSRANEIVSNSENSLVEDVELSLATFSGGCFWCIEAAYDKYDGIDSVISGYTGGNIANPDYKQVSSGTTGHIESVQVYYDPSKITYNDLLEILWRQMDPTDGGGSFVDRGYQYTSAIFYHNEEQRMLAEESLKKYDESGFYQSEIKTQILEAGDFYDAEEYHQDYHIKNPVRYNLYRASSGRDRYRIAQWGDDRDYQVPGSEGVRSREEVIASLTSIQRKITLENGTERPFNNEYWDNTESGIYIDHFSGEALFSSTDKFKSGTGWPSFTKPINEDNIIERLDKSFFLTRVEIRSNEGDAHLGHLFDDGPAPSYNRYCMNSAAMNFVPVEEMEEKGYEEYLYLFE